MLNSILIENFKSYKSARLPLAPLTLMIGANASGKTNAIEAFRFLSWVVGSEKLSSINNRIKDSERVFRGDMRDLVHKGDEGFTLGVAFDCSEFGIEMTTHFGEILVKQQSGTLYSKTQQLMLRVCFFDFIPSVMRGKSYPETQLRNTGANLAGVLYTLWQDNNQQAHILAFIQSLPEQDIKALKFYTDHRGRVELALIETFGNQDQEQHIELLSDGTLRVLAIAAALLSAPEGSTIVIEGVDNSVHPSRAKQLLTTMLEHAERRGLRLLLSTHNPALMDALPDEALGDVVFCYRDPKDGDSRLVRLSDLVNYMGLVMQGSLGQLVTRGVVERFVKTPVTPAENKQNALDWLAMMQGVTK
jgi:predicted ATPase